MQPPVLVTVSMAASIRGLTVTFILKFMEQVHSFFSLLEREIPVITLGDPFKRQTDHAISMAAK